MTGPRIEPDASRTPRLHSGYCATVADFPEIENTAVKPAAKPMVSKAGMQHIGFIQQYHLKKGFSTVEQ